MSLTVLPGQPNNTQQAVCQANWQSHTILAYCSGNNVILTTSKFEYFQTIYLDLDCVCCDINESNGFLAIGSGTTVFVYKPMLSIFTTKTPPKWVLCCQFEQPCEGDQVFCVKWGSSETANELVVGTTHLSLWKIQDVYGEYKPLLEWTKLQSCPVYRVDITQDAHLICSMGKYDKTVKVWERIPLGTDVSVFEVSILSHGGLADVTTFRWKRLASGWEDDENYSYVLYTLTTDKIMHVWTVYSTNGRKTIEMWGEIELAPEHRFAFIVDSGLLPESARCDVLVTGDRNCNLNVYKMYHLSHNPPKLIKVKQQKGMHISAECFSSDSDFLYFAETKLFDGNKDTLSFVVHEVGGPIKHSLINSEHLVVGSGSTNDIQASFQHEFTGHLKSIQKLVRSSDGESVLSISRYATDNCLWLPKFNEKTNTFKYLEKCQIFETESPVKDAILLEKGSLVVLFLQSHKFQVWKADCGNPKRSQLVESINYDSQSDRGFPLLFVNVPTKCHNHNKHYIALIYKDGSCDCFKIENDKATKIDSGNLAIDNIHRISTIDPVSYTYTGNRPAISSITKEGVIKCFKGIFEDNDTKLRWAVVSVVNTGKPNIFKLKGSSVEKMCCIDETQLEVTIWDLKRGVLEYSETFQDKVVDVDWTSSYSNMSIFSLGFLSYSLTYTQLRYDYMYENPSYSPIRKTDISKFTSHSMGDSIWLRHGLFMMAAGNQIFLKDKKLEMERDYMARQMVGSREIQFKTIFGLSRVLNGPLPVFHPQFLIQAMYMGKFNLVKEILLKLLLAIRNNELEDDGLDLFVQIEDYKLLSGSNNDYKFDKGYQEPFDQFNALVSQLLREKLTTLVLPDLTRHQQVTLIIIVETLEQIDRLGDSIDEYGMNFLLGYKLFNSHKQTQESLTMRDVSWGLHCAQKDILLSEIDDIKMPWERAKELKLAYWVRQDDLVRKIEQIAKIEFSENDKRDPNSCTIFYLALKKKHVLLGLWRISAGHPDQSKMLNFLNHDFSEDRWKTAALKNSYVLLSKHRDMLAAAFFLLADSLKDCVNVLVRKICDMDLAIAVCRLYEGDNGPVLSHLLTQHLLPTCAVNNDRWTASFIYWKMKNKPLAIKSLIQGFGDTEAGPLNKNVVNKTFMVDDPVLLLVYIYLRDKNIAYFTGSLEIEEGLEYKILQKVCEVYQRLGCDYLGLSLVKNWKFINKSLTKRKIKEQTLPSSIGVSAGVPALRPSIFDKFSSDSETPPPVKSASNEPVRSMLDMFSEPSAETITEKSSSNVTSHKSSSLLDEYMIPSPPLQHTSPKPTSLLDGYSSPLPPSKDVVQDSQKSLLSDFANDKPPSESQPPNASLVSEPSASVPAKHSENQVTSKPRNLLDDFM